MKTKSSSKIIGVIIVILLVILIGGVTYLTYVMKADEARKLQNVNVMLADDLYNEVTSQDLVQDYPESPEDVMRFYDKTIYLLYNNKITDDNLLKMVLSKQRGLYDNELLELNPFEEQFSKLLISIDELNRQKVSIKSISHVSYEYDEKNPEVCMVNTVQYLQGEENLFIVFILRKDEDNKWRIVSRKSSDKNFDFDNY